MIVGVFAPRRGPAVRLRLTGPSGQSEEILAFVDTGFNGTLVLPPTLVAWLSLEKEDTSKARLADGIARPFDVYNVSVDWDGRTRDVLAFAMGDTPLIGTSLLRGYRLTIDAVDGPVTIGPIPGPTRPALG